MTKSVQSVRRKLMAAACYLAFGSFAFGSLAGQALAQDDFPTQPIRLVVPFPSGGSTDALGRLLAQEMSSELGQPVIVENKAGASGDIGAVHVARSAPDGYTLLLVSGAFVVNPSLGAPYDAVKDFAPVAYVATVPSVLAVHPSVKAKTLQELVALIKQSPPGTFNFATPGTGSVQHLTGELLKREAGVDLTHVPYSGAGPAITALLGNHVQMAVVSVPSLKGQIEAGNARAIATTLKARVPTLAQVPTFVEAGYPSIVVDQVQGLLAPAGTPPAIVEKLNRVVVSIIHRPDIHEKLIEQGYVPLGTTPQEFASELERLTRKWAAVIKDANIRKE